MRVIRSLFTIAAAIAGAAFPVLAAEHYIVHLSLAEETASHPSTNSVPRRLCEPTIAIQDNVPAEIRVGGSTMVGDEKVEFGTLARVRVTKRTDESVEIHGKLDVSSINSSTAESVVRQSTTLFFKRTIPLNKTVRFKLKNTDDHRQWCDVKVEVAERN